MLLLLTSASFFYIQSPNLGTDYHEILPIKLGLIR